MNCVRCNKRLESSSAVNQMCQECLNDIQTQTPSRTFGLTQGWACPKCGAVLAPNQAYCVFCAPAPKITCGMNRTGY